MKKVQTKKLLVGLIIALVAICCCACATGGNGEVSDDGQTGNSVQQDKPISIATIAETEGTSIGQLMVQALIANGYQVDDQTGTAANINVMREAVINGEVDMIFDYDGDAYWYLDDDQQNPSLDDFRQPEVGWQLINEYDQEHNGIVWLPPSQANNTFAIATTKAIAEETGIEDLHDFADYVNNGGEVKLITPDYWLNDDSNLPAIEKTYGFTIDRDTQCIVVDGLNEKMVAEGVDGANFCLVFACQGSMNALDMVVIKDPLNAELRYCFCPVISQQTLEKYPEIETILTPIFEGLTDEDVRDLNEKIQVQGLPGDQVAIEYLQEKGFID